MANANPPKKNQAWSTRITLTNYSNGDIKTNPTIAAGDFKIDIDGAGLNNFATLPTVSPAGGDLVLISFSAAEMNGDIISFVWKDQTSPKEWVDDSLTINTTA